MKFEPTAAQIGKKKPPETDSFDYAATAEPPQPSWEAWGGMIPGEEREGQGDVATGAGEAAQAKGEIAWQTRLADEARHSFEAGRQRGIQEGRVLEREAFVTAQAAGERLRVAETAEAIERFESERRRYFEAVEREVVNLALAVAARVLRREAQMDPLLLTGAVRVALGQLSGSTRVCLQVPPAELELWTETIAHLPNLAQKPMVRAKEGMEAGDCELETELGSVDLGLRAQMAEIERGFFDSARTSLGLTNRDTVQVSEAQA